jgi:hypothetical protein
VPVPVPPAGAAGPARERRHPPAQAVGRQQFDPAIVRAFVRLHGAGKVHFHQPGALEDAKTG